MLRALLIGLFVIVAAPAWAQTPVAQTPGAQTPGAFGDSAKALIGSWEFSNADRDKTCTATFKTDPAPGGFKVEFDKNCVNLFSLVAGVAAWSFPEGDLLRFLDAQGKTLVEFSEVEDGIYEAPTPGVGVLFLQNAASAGPAPKPPEQVAGTWNLTRGGKAICVLTLSPTAAKEAFALTIKPGCDAAIAKLGFVQWRLDREELILTPARGTPWRFEEIEGGNWRRTAETADPITLVRQ
ncbi:MAG: AprI/Inh family metalloprotease inhibitor [Pseudolabrys sp.]